MGIHWITKSASLEKISEETRGELEKIAGVLREDLAGAIVDGLRWAGVGDGLPPALSLGGTCQRLAVLVDRLVGICGVDRVDALRRLRDQLANQGEHERDVAGFGDGVDASAMFDAMQSISSQLDSIRHPDPPLEQVMAWDVPRRDPNERSEHGCIPFLGDRQRYSLRCIRDFARHRLGSAELDDQNRCDLGLSWLDDLLDGHGRADAMPPRSTARKWMKVTKVDFAGAGGAVASDPSPVNASESDVDDRGPRAGVAWDEKLLKSWSAALRVDASTVTRAVHRGLADAIDAALLVAGGGELEWRRSAGGEGEWRRAEGRHRVAIESWLASEEHLGRHLRALCAAAGWSGGLLRDWAAELRWTERRAAEMDLRTTKVSSALADAIDAALTALSSGCELEAMHRETIDAWMAGVGQYLWDRDEHVIAIRELLASIDAARASATATSSPVGGCMKVYAMGLRHAARADGRDFDPALVGAVDRRVANGYARGFFDAIDSAMSPLVGHRPETPEHVTWEYLVELNEVAKSSVDRDDVMSGCAIDWQSASDRAAARVSEFARRATVRRESEAGWLTAAEAAQHEGSMELDGGAVLAPVAGDALGMARQRARQLGYSGASNLSDEDLRWGEDVVGLMARHRVVLMRFVSYSVSSSRRMHAVVAALASLEGGELEERHRRELAEFSTYLRSGAAPAMFGLPEAVDALLAAVSREIAPPASSTRVPSPQQQVILERLVIELRSSGWPSLSRAADAIRAWLRAASGEADGDRAAIDAWLSPNPGPVPGTAEQRDAVRALMRSITITGRSVLEVDELEMLADYREYCRRGGFAANCVSAIDAALRAARSGDAIDVGDRGVLEDIATSSLARAPDRWLVKLGKAIEKILRVADAKSSRDPASRVPAVTAETPSLIGDVWANDIAWALRCLRFGISNERSNCAQSIGALLNAGLASPGETISRYGNVEQRKIELTDAGRIALSSINAALASGAGDAEINGIVEGWIARSPASSSAVASPAASSSIDGDGSPDSSSTRVVCSHLFRDKASVDLDAVLASCDDIITNRRRDGSSPKAIISADVLRAICYYAVELRRLTLDDAPGVAHGFARRGPIVGGDGAADAEGTVVKAVDADGLMRPLSESGIRSDDSWIRSAVDVVFGRWGKVSDDVVAALSVELGRCVPVDRCLAATVIAIDEAVSSAAGDGDDPGVDGSTYRGEFLAPVVLLAIAGELFGGVK